MKEMKLWNGQTPHAVQLLTQREEKHSNGNPAGGAAPNSGTAHDDCTPSELVDVPAKFQQKARENIQAWLAQVWMQAVIAFLTGQEAEK